MKKFNFITLVLAAMTVFGFTDANAQVSGMPAGFITAAPTVSTAQAPVWYNMMSSNLVAERANRYLSFDGTTLITEQFNDGIGDGIQADKYIWRLEAGPSGAGYVVLINKTTGKKLFVAADAATNGTVSAQDEGIEWKMGAALDLPGAAATAVEGQTFFNFEGGADNRFLNAGDGTTYLWGLIVFNVEGSTNKSSGWFFYPVTATTGIEDAKDINIPLVVSFNSELVIRKDLCDLNKVDIFNLQGQKVLSVTQNFSAISTTDLVAGTYIVQVSTTTKVYTQKVIKK